MAKKSRRARRQATKSGQPVLTSRPVRPQATAAPKEVETAVNAIWKGNVLMTPVGGGVHIDARKAISVEHVLPDDEGVVADKRETITLDGLADGQWWWD